MNGCGRELSPGCEEGGAVKPNLAIIHVKVRVQDVQKMTVRQKTESHLRIDFAQFVRVAEVLPIVVFDLPTGVAGHLKPRANLHGASFRHLTITSSSFDRERPVCVLAQHFGVPHFVAGGDRSFGENTHPEKPAIMARGQVSVDNSCRIFYVPISSSHLRSAQRVVFWKQLVLIR